MQQSWAMVAALLLLAACGDDRPTYHGHQGSTKGVPGWSAAGNKMHPNVKLGKPYTVMGRTYVPRHQPDYVQEGMASWYGPGFHGLRTANGEEFSTHDMTAAHPTLPLPSIVRVTNLANDRQVYVRVNDRGPFAHNRIIDLSKEAASRIDMIRTGTARVRVEYMPAESQKFVEMITQGRGPGSIDIASEVIGQSTQYAQAAPVNAIDASSNMPAAAPEEDVTWMSFFNPISSAQAEEPSDNVAIPGYAPPVPSAEWGSQPRPPSQRGEPQVQSAGDEVFITRSGADAMETEALDPVLSTTTPAPVTAPAPIAEPVPTPAPVIDSIPAPAQAPVAVPASGIYVQLGAFGVEANAKTAQSNFADLGQTSIVLGTNASGATLYRVRVGPLESEARAQEIVAIAAQRGIAGAAILRQ